VPDPAVIAVAWEALRAEVAFADGFVADERDLDIEGDDSRRGTVSLRWVLIDEDEPGARHSRRRVLGEAADQGALLFPAHFPGPGAAEVRRAGDRFTVKERATWQ
jgi:glyoxylase-like metal-dependent hydrolase (beta-lactamase superfamily II)